MVCIGIHAAHYNPAVAIVSPTAIQYFAEEDRFTRKKYAPFEFPGRALQYGIQAIGINRSDVSAIALGWDLSLYYNGKVSDAYRRIGTKYKIDQATLSWQNKNLEKFQPENVKTYLDKNFFRALGWSDCPPILTYDHHKTHAILASIHSGFETAIVATIDGSGELNSTVIWRYTRGALEPIYSFPIPHSFGWYYAAFTEFLGYRAYEGEFKIMALAAYGGKNEKIQSIVREVLAITTEYEYELDPYSIFFGKHSYSERFTDVLVKRLGRNPRQTGEAICQWHADLAYAVQDQLETAVKNILRWAHRETGLSNVCLAGGVAQNVKLAGAISEEPWVTDVFAHPLSGDAGAALGAALLAAQDTFGSAPAELPTLYLGPVFDNRDITAAISAAGLTSIQPTDLADLLARELSSGKIIGFYNGPLEAGPRALGHRSILADPRSPRMRDKINLMKGRELWRPVAPVVLSSRAADYFKLSASDQYMTMARMATNRAQTEIPAAIHADGTLRPQVLSSADSCLRLFDLLSAFQQLTGIPALLNTSFNGPGQPIVCTPDDAIKCFLELGLDYLVLEDRLIAHPDTV